MSPSTHENSQFKIKLIFPSAFERFKPYSQIAANVLPYGMSVIAAHLRAEQYAVEQEDLQARFNNYSQTSSRLLAFKVFKNTLLNNAINYETLSGFLRSGKQQGKIERVVRKFMDAVPVEGYNLIGFSLFSHLQFGFALVLAKLIKERTRAPVVFGGPFVTIWGEIYYPHALEFVDYMIVGDGRIPLGRLIQYLRGNGKIGDIPGLLYKEDKRIVSTPRQEFPFEDIPVPDFDGLPLDLYRTKEYEEKIVLPYQISKGCASRCSFCTFVEASRKLAFKPYEKVVTELRQMKQRYKSDMFFFCDESINNSYEYLDGLCRAFIQNKLDIHWIAHAKAGNLDKSILELMWKSGCQRLAFGVESGSDRLLRHMNKGFTVEEAGRVIREASGAGITVNISLIAGYPHETKSDIGQTVDFVRKNKQFINMVWVYKFSLNHGSAMSAHPEKYGIENLKPGPEEFCYTYDEVGGLKWEKKKAQQKYSRWRMLLAVHNAVQFNKKRHLLLHMAIELLRFVKGSLVAIPGKLFGQRN